MLNTRGRAGFVLVKGVRSGHSCAVKIVENIHQHAAEQGLIKNGTLKKGIEPKAKEFMESFHGSRTAHCGHEPSSGAPTFLSAWASAKVLADKNVGAPTARFMGSGVEVYAKA